MEAASPATQGWRGHVTVVFADLCDYTALGEVADPEEIERLRREIERVGSQVIQKYGGSVNQLYGDGLLAVFGVPSACEDDSKRAIEAAIELLDAARKIEPDPAANDFEVHMHIGVHCGLVFARDGDALHGRYDLTGDTVNTAARLCQAAGRDQILVSETALRGNEAFFSGIVPRELTLKGKRTAMLAHEVASRSEVRSRFEARTRRGLTEFVARETQLAELEHTLEQPRGERLVIVSGTAGIGKSRLLEEFRRRIAARGACTLSGCCAGSGEMVPLEPYIHAFRQLFGILATTPIDEAVRSVEGRIATLPEEAQSSLPALLQLLSLNKPAASEVRRTSPARSIEDALTEFVALLAVEAPLYLLLDDWQWADDLSRKLLNKIRRLFGTRIGIVVAMREADETDPALEGAVVIRLSPFNEEQTARAVRALRSDALDMRIAQAIHAHSGGNPLFVEELSRCLPENAHGELLLDSSRTPSTLQGVIQARVASLPPTQAEVLRAASVMGKDFLVTHLSQVVETEGLTACLTALVAEDLIYATELDGVYRFKHGITRDVIYETVRIAERRRMHHAVARAIEQSAATDDLPDQSEALAYHYKGAGDHEHAAQYAELAGNKAIAASALDRARFQYEAALAALDHLPSDPQRMQRWVSISTRWAGACVYDPAPYQLPLLRRAQRFAEELRDRTAEGLVNYWLTWILNGLGEYTEAGVHCHRAIALADAAKEDWFVAQAYANLGLTHSLSGEFTEGVEALTHGIDMRRASGDHTSGRRVSQGFAYSLASRSFVGAALGDFEAADRDIQEARALVCDSGLPIEASVFSLNAIVELFRGQWQTSENVAIASRNVAARVYSVYLFAITSAFAAYSRYMRTRDPSALIEMRNAIQWLERNDSRMWISLTYGLMAEAAAVAEDFALAVEYANRALARAKRSDPLGEVMAYRALARRHAQFESTSPESNLYLTRAFEAAKQRCSKREAAITQLLLAELALRSGDASACYESASAARAEFERMKMAWYEAEASKLVRLAASDDIVR
jgi:class 3 adenylate cyclase/tetratricopeptide (TPR) repeat protein